MATTLQGQADARLWNRVLALHARVEQRLGAVLQRHHGLGLSEYRALALLAEAPDGELRMQDLAAGLGLNQSSVTRLVGRLDAAGFGYRDLCPDDRRGVYTVITDAGRERYRQARPAYEETLTATLDEAEETAEVLGATRRSG
ncbi:MarR family transcriptional regulator [Actinomadura logoneensis]|uniref:MarR family transcriptional regulator n=1 Tax=Actinomadura logoneensis TaxID=2293572 RepID=A0A372J8U2_9ACTN|nr:MarR family transcriptional regulator [Actinomadura logoneensis]RFU36400.1 MarR family transcriptional regulator [Actinomadura logoneensis]